MLNLLRSLFFESIVLLACVEVLVIAIVLALYRRWPTSGRRRAIWLTLIVCVMLTALQRVVETDREKIRAAVKAMAAAVDAGDVPILGEYLDQDFRDRGVDRRAWLEDVRQRLQRWQIDQAKVGGFSIDVNGSQAVAWFWASCQWRSGGQSEQSAYSTWKLAFIRRDNGWKLHRVVDAKFGPGGMLDYTAIQQF